MKLKVILAALPLLATLCNGQASTAIQHYDGLCPATDDEVEIQPGLFVTYYCDQASVTSVRAVGHPATNPDDCVLACEQSTVCIGSMWSARAGSACYLVEHSSQPELRSKTRVVYMSYRRAEEADEIFPDDEEEELFPEPDDCEAQTELLQSSLNSCQAREATWRKKQNGLNQCPNKHEKTVTHGKWSYKIHCNKRGKGFTEYKSTAHGFDDCLDTCSSDAKCKAVHYIINSPNPCKMLAQINRNVEPDHSSTPQIAAIPTKPK